MIEVVSVGDLMLLNKFDIMRKPTRLKVFSFEVLNGVTKALVLSGDLHNFRVIKGLDLLDERGLKYFKSYLEDLLVCKIPCGPYDTSIDLRHASITFGVEVETI